MVACLLSKRAVFLDRDGVIVVPEFREGRSFAPARLQDFNLYAGARESVEKLREAGYRVFVVTNQPDVGAGKVAREVVESMHAIIKTLLPIEDLLVCYHTREDNCSCRKPKPGMLLELLKTHTLDPAVSFIVGDRDSDVEAGVRAGCRTVFIDLGYTNEKKSHKADFTVKSLDEAVEAILGFGRQLRR